MSYRWLYVVSALIAAPLGNLTTPFTTHWGDMRAKHMWDATSQLGDSRSPSCWYCGRPPHCASAQRGNPLMHPKYGYDAYLSMKQVAELVAQCRDMLELGNF